MGHFVLALERVSGISASPCYHGQKSQVPLEDLYDPNIFM